MIPSKFDYVRPSSLDEAVRALADAGDDAKVIAGGQRTLFASEAVRRGLEQRKVEQLPDGRLSLVYGIGGD